MFNNTLFERKADIFSLPFSEPVPALFLDRDGVLIEEKHYLRSPDQVLLCPGSQRLVSMANKSGWPVIVITNQSGIARNYFSWSEYDQVTQRLRCLLGPAAYLSAVYASGEHPKMPSKSNSWRKPSPMMLIEAAFTLNLDLSRSILIGDRLSDLLAGVNAGVSSVFHVLNGHGFDERESVLCWYERCHFDGLQFATQLKLLDSLMSFPFEVFC